MNIKRLTLLAVATCLVTLGLAASASAATKWCVTLANGQEICFPLLVEEIRIKIPPDPGPYLPVDIRELSRALTDILGPTPQSWIWRDALGERAIMMDLEAGQAYEIPQLEAGF